jgi:hypothetical protein
LHAAASTQRKEDREHVQDIPDAKNAQKRCALSVHASSEELPPLEALQSLYKYREYPANNDNFEERLVSLILGDASAVISQLHRWR